MTASVSTLFKEIRNRAHYASQGSLAKAMGCSTEYVRLIETKGRLPSDRFLGDFLRTCRPPASLAVEIRQTVAEQRLVRKHGKDLRQHKGAEEVGIRLSRKYTEVLQSIGVNGDDLEYALDELSKLVTTELR